MKPSILRIATVTSDSLPLLENCFLSDAAWPRVGTNHRHCLEEQQYQHPTEANHSGRTIRRTFAFDEWDEKPEQNEDLLSKDRNSAKGNGNNNNNNDDEHSSGDFDDWEHDLQHTIQRSFAFDEWDEELSKCDAGRQRRAAAQNNPFVPIQTNNGTSHNTTPSPKRESSFHRFGIPDTKFDLDATAQSTTMVVTPSPPPPPKLQRPVPLYSHHQSLQLPPTTLFEINSSKSKARSTNTSNNNQHQQHGLFSKDSQSMETMLRTSFFQKPSFPPFCESIPRQASAFSIPVSVNRESSPPAFATNDGDCYDNDTNSCDSNQHQQQQPQEVHWFDMYGSGTTFIFEDDDDSVFESPTSTVSEEDSLFSASAVPRFIVCCYQNNE